MWSKFVEKTTMKDLFALPDNLPVPVDDGACDHLSGSRFPSLPLVATSGDSVDIGSISGTVVVYFYPMIGSPDSPPLIGWNEIPGARGCTPQSCGFRDHYSEVRRFAGEIIGVSAQSLEEQKSAKLRLALPFELLNDSAFLLAGVLRLPTFEYEGKRLIKRLALIVENGIIRKVFYPVFPPDNNARQVIDWFENKNS